MQLFLWRTVRNLFTKHLYDILNNMKTYTTHIRATTSPFYSGYWRIFLLFLTVRPFFFDSSLLLITFQIVKSYDKQKNKNPTITLSWSKRRVDENMYRSYTTQRPRKVGPALCIICKVTTLSSFNFNHFNLLRPICYSHIPFSTLLLHSALNNLMLLINISMV